MEQVAYRCVGEDYPGGVDDLLGVALCSLGVILRVVVSSATSNRVCALFLGLGAYGIFPVYFNFGRSQSGSHSYSRVRDDLALFCFYGTKGGGYVRPGARFVQVLCRVVSILGVVCAFVVFCRLVDRLV